MRELRFRVWDSTPGYELMTATVSLADIEKGFNVSGNNRTVLQWTGLTDRNGVDIYEGDIIRYTPLSGKTKSKRPHVDMEVYWRADIGQWRLRWNQGEAQQQSLWSVASDVKHEVIGNIYENQELLK